VETGLGYATDVGARLKASWFKPWVNDRGHSLNADLELSQREQNLETSYKFPLRDVANDYYQLSFGYKNKDLLDTDSTSYNLKGERHWLLSNQWQRTLSLRWLYEDYVQGAQRDTSNLVLPGFAFSRNRDTGGSMPLDADNYLLSVEAANTSWGSDTDFIRLYGRAGWIGSFSEDQRWLVRMDAGAILQEQIANIPPSLRFFAGGDSSLRGYGYQTIAPVNAEQELIGGIRLATVNLEYQHRVKPITAVPGTTSPTGNRVSALGRAGRPRSGRSGWTLPTAWTMNPMADSVFISPWGRNYESANATGICVHSADRSTGSWQQVSMALAATKCFIRVVIIVVGAGIVRQQPWSAVAVAATAPTATRTADTAGER
jgi:hypothetical protein